MKYVVDTMTLEEAKDKFGEISQKNFGMTTFFDFDTDEGVWRPAYDIWLQPVGYELYVPLKETHIVYDESTNIPKELWDKIGLNNDRQT